MNLSYQCANPTTQDSSFVLRFHLNSGKNPVVLVDSGPGVDLSNLLNDDDYLAGVLLTHLHQDHYISLPENIKRGTRIFTSEINRTILQNVLVNYAPKHSQTPTEWATASLFKDIQVPSDWEEITEEIHVRRIPVGHAFGATGFVIRFRENNDWQHIVISGDVSFDSVAGMPPATDILPIEPTVLFVNTPENGVESENNLTEILNSILESRDNNCTLVATSSLTSIQFALIVAKIAEQYDESLQATLVGLAGGMFEALDYTNPHIETYPHPDEIESLTKPGHILFAGSENLKVGYSAQIHQRLSRIGGETFQLLGWDNKHNPQNQTEAVTTFQYSQHATERELADYVRALGPIHTILGHGGYERLKSQLRDCFVWESGNTRDPRLLYSSTKGWHGPPWLDSGVVDTILQKATQRASHGYRRTAPWPTIGQQVIDLKQEGVNVNSLSLTPKTTESSDTVYVTGPETQARLGSQKPSKYDPSSSNIHTKARVVKIDEETILLKPTELPDDLEHGDELSLRIVAQRLQDGEDN